VRVDHDLVVVPEKRRVQGAGVQPHLDIPGRGGLTVIGERGADLRGERAAALRALLARDEALRAEAAA
jgi:hypothetical protein